MTIKDKKDYFLHKFKNTNWDIIYRLIKTPDFEVIIQQLTDNVSEGKRFTPKYSRLFDSFLKCPYDDLKVVFVGQDPYPQLNVADGLAFSSSITMKEPKSLSYIFDELQKQYPDASRNCDLSRWAEQGVLLLNTALTVEIGNIGSHYNIWKKFMITLFDFLNLRDDLIIVLLGRKAEEFELLLNNNKILKVPHPASAGYKGGVWNSDNLFVKINTELENLNKSKIKW